MRSLVAFINNDSFIALQKNKFIANFIDKLLLEEAMDVIWFRGIGLIFAGVCRVVLE